MTAKFKQDTGIMRKGCGRLARPSWVARRWNGGKRGRCRSEERARERTGLVQSRDTEAIVGNDFSSTNADIVAHKRSTEAMRTMAGEVIHIARVSKQCVNGGQTPTLRIKKYVHCQKRQVSTLVNS